MFTMRILVQYTDNTTKHIVFRHLLKEVTIILYALSAFRREIFLLYYLEGSTNNTVVDCTVNDKPLVYLKNVNEGFVTGEVGQVIAS